MVFQEATCSTACLATLTGSTTHYKLAGFDLLSFLVINVLLLSLYLISDKLQARFIDGTDMAYYIDLPPTVLLSLYALNTGVLTIYAWGTYAA